MSLSANTNKNDLKREFLDLSPTGSSSSGASNFRISPSLKEEMSLFRSGAYTEKYLDLLREAVLGRKVYGRLFIESSWDAFTAELNEMIKLEDPQFRGFSTYSVVEYGRELRENYKNFKENPEGLNQFQKYEECFEECDKCANIPIFPFLPSSTYSRTHSTGSNKRYRPSISGNDSVSGRLAHLLSSDELSNTMVDRAMDYFQGNHLRGETWSLMSEERQVSFLMDILNNNDN